MSAKYSANDLTTELNRISAITGRPVTRRDIEEFSTISPDTFERRIGRWTQADMFEALGLEHPSLWNVDSLSPEDGGWLAGFYCGEGYFGFKFLHKTRSTMRIIVALTVRDDDRELLERVRKLWNLSELVNIFSNEHRRAKGEHCGDEAKLHIHSINTIYCKIIPTFCKFPIYGKKGREFEIFARGIEILHHKIIARGGKSAAYTQDELLALTGISLELNEMRQHPIFRSSKANRT